MRNYCIDVRIVYSTFKVKKLFSLKMSHSPVSDGQCHLQIKLFA